MSVQERTDVVTAFLEDARGNILLLKRSDAVRTYPGQWGGVSGYCETKDPLLQAEVEIREETGLGRGDVSLLRKGTPVAVDDPGDGGYWRVHPFRFRLENENKSLDLSREHTDYVWIPPDEISKYETVPELDTALLRTRT